MKHRLIALLLLCTMVLASMSLMTAAADDTGIPDGYTVVLNENFDDYDADADVKVSRLPEYFTADANSIGDGYIKIQENAETGNLHLMSHVFTQTYLTKGLKDGYAFSIDVFQVQGDKQCTLFLRAPATGAAYYEADGHDGSSCCQSGINIYFRTDALEINVQSYDAAEPGSVKYNLFSFNLPEGVHFNDGESYTTFTAVDDNNTIKIYVEGTHLATLVMEEGKRGNFGSLKINDPCFKKITVKDAEGAELGVVENTLVSSKESVVGWATRVANMIVDNVVLALPSDSVPTEAPTTAPTEPVTEPVTNAVTEGSTAEVGTKEPEAAVTDMSGDITEGSTAADEPVDGTEEDSKKAEEPTDKEKIVIGGDIYVCVLVAIMLVAIGGAAGYITMKVRK